MECPKILDQVSELRGRKTSMEIRNVSIGKKIWKYDIVHRPDAAAAIVRIQGTNKYVFIKQFRVPANQEIIEGVAGCLDGNELPSDCIVREIEEETGYKVAKKGTGHSKLVSFGPTLSSPGYTDEIVHLFYAEVENVMGSQRPDDDERIKVVHYSFDEFSSLVEKGAIKDAHTLLGWYMHIAKGFHK
jgi:ADP-ribose pyrophosphatase